MSAQGLSSRAIIGEFYRRLEQDAGNSWISQISMLFQSDQESETYRWLGQSPIMREWVGGRQAKGFRETGMTIFNKHFEATLEVLLNELRRDKTGQLMIRIGELAERTNAHWASLLSTLIIEGEKQLCYDGHAFFDTKHQEGDSGIQKNILDINLSSLPIPADERGSANAPSARVMKACLLRGVRQLLSLKDDRGEPMNENAKSFLALVPTALMDVANAAIFNPVLSGSETNDLANSRNFSLSYVVNSRLAWTDQFVIFRTDGSVAPFIRQEETPVKLQVLDETSEEAFKHQRCLYGVDCWRNVGYGYWQKACLVKLTSKA